MAQSSISLPARSRRDERRVRRGFWAKMRRVAARTGFAREAAAAYYCALDPETPTRVRVILLGALAYFIMPADAVPDILAGIGFTDDAAVLLAAWRAVAPQIRDRHRDRARLALSKVGTNTPVSDQAADQ